MVSDWFSLRPEVWSGAVKTSRHLRGDPTRVFTVCLQYVYSTQTDVNRGVSGVFTPVSLCVLRVERTSIRRLGPPERLVSSGDP